MSLLKINKNENPYSIIGNYIENHISLIDNIIATISIDGIIHNELFLVEITYNNNFVWLNDWWEGEENIELIDFFFVSDACKKYNNNDFISRQLAIDALRTCYDTETITMDNGDEYINCGNAVGEIEQLPSIQPEIIYCKDCKHHWTYKCMDSFPIERCDLEQTLYDAEHDFCSLAERKEDG